MSSINEVKAYLDLLGVPYKKDRIWGGIYLPPFKLRKRAIWETTEENILKLIENNLDYVVGNNNDGFK